MFKMPGTVGNELFYAMLYLLNFTTGPFYLFVPLAVITFPVAVAKTGIALLQVSIFFSILTRVSDPYPDPHGSALI
jgi:hypothetical protein